MTEISLPARTVKIILQSRFVLLSNMKFLTFLILIFFSNQVWSTTWAVGPTQIYTVPSQVVNLVQDGDTIEIDAGVYLNDAVKWTKKNLKIIGLGIGTNRTILQFTTNIPNGKGIFVFDSLPYETFCINFLPNAFNSSPT